MNSAHTKKITLATVKSFITRNLGKILIKTSSRFDGMCDGVRNVEGAAYRTPDVTKFNKTDEAQLGIQGVWFVRGSRDYFTIIDTPEFTGYEVYNCCGTWSVVVPAKSQAGSRERVK
jgi:hypothetical protein